MVLSLPAAYPLPCGVGQLGPRIDAILRIAHSWDASRALLYYPVFCARERHEGGPNNRATDGGDSDLTSVGYCPTAFCLLYLPPTCSLRTMQHSHIKPLQPQHPSPNSRLNTGNSPLGTLGMYTRQPLTSSSDDFTIKATPYAVTMEGTRSASASPEF